MRRENHIVLPLLTFGVLGTYASHAWAADPFEWTGTHAYGDFNGDGEIDVVASSPESDCNKGAVHVLLGSGGSATWTEDSSGVLGTATCDDYFGAALAVGDFDGNGFDDLAIGTPGGSDSGSSDSGSVHILYGSSAGLTATGDQLWHQDSSGILGVAGVGDYFGSALAVGDFNCDGYDDLGVGTPGEIVGTTLGAGAVNVIFGSASGLSTLDSMWYQGTGGVDGTPETADNFGAALAAGNFNGDTSSETACDDLAIAAPNEDQSTTVIDSGYVYIIDGSTSGLSTTGDQGIDQNVTDVAGTAESNDQFGLRLEARDLDGDGYDDLWATVPGDGCSTSAGWGRHQFRGSSGGLSYSDDAITCDEFDCTIASGEYACEAGSRPVHGSSGTDEVAVHYGNDIVYGWAGSDTVLPGGGRDLVFGGLGNDELHGSAGRDILVGGSGDDSIYVDLACEIDAGDVIDGGPGTDTVYSHLTQTQLASAGVTLVSIENFVSISEDDSDEDETCGLPVLTGNAEVGSACFGFDLNCSVPQSVALTLDQEPVFFWGAEPTSRPETTCVDTNGVSEDEHEFVLRVTCDDEIVESRPLVLETKHDPFEVVSLTPNQTLYEHGDTIVIDLEASETGLTIDMDFSAIDTGYTSNAETVTEIGGGLYRVSYTLSSGNTRTGGYHRVSYEVHDSTGNEVSTALTLTYVPDGLMDHVIDSGAYSPKPTRTWVVDPQAVTLISVTDTEVDVEPDALDDEHPDFSTGTTGHTRPGRVFELEIETEGREPKSLFAIVEDPARTGHITVPLSPTSTNCTATECGYTVPLVVGARQPGAGVGQTDLTLSIVTLDGLGTAGDLWVLPGIPIPTSTYLVKGTVKYRPSATKPNCNDTLVTEPYACDTLGPAETLPVANMLVRVVTTCPGEHYTWTDEAGDFQLWFDMPTECADEPAMLRVSSVVSPARRVVVFDRAPGEQTQFATKADLVAALPTDGTDYRIYNDYVVVDGAESLTFIPEEDALTSDPLVLNDIMIDDPGAKNAMYLASEGRKVHDYLLPWLGNKLTQFNILIDEQEIVFATDKENANTSFFAAHIHDGFVHILPKNKWSNLTLAHEYGHYVHHHFGIDGWQYYGRYSEPMADAQAATIVGESHKAVNSFDSTVNLDFNGHKDENGVSIQPVMHFYASPAAYTDPLPACYDLTETCCDTFPNDGVKDEAAVIKACMMVESAGWYAAIFHDLSDGVGNELEAYGHGNFDQVDGHGASPDPLDHAIMDVVLNYMGGGLWPQNPNYFDRGIPHTDVVDVLDGMMCRGHMTLMDAQVLLRDVMNFEYDFAPNAGVCP